MEGQLSSQYKILLYDVRLETSGTEGGTPGLKKECSVLKSKKK